MTIKKYIYVNGIGHNVMSFKEVISKELKHGIMQKIINKEELPQSIYMTYKSYHVDAISIYDNRVKTFIYSEKEAKEDSIFID